MDHNSNPKPEILKGSQSQRQPAARAAQFNHALQRTAGVRSGFKTHLLGPPSLSFALGDITRL